LEVFKVILHVREAPHVNTFDCDFRSHIEKELCLAFFTDESTMRRLTQSFGLMLAMFNNNQQEELCNVVF